MDQHPRRSRRSFLVTAAAGAVAAGLPDRSPARASEAGAAAAGTAPAGPIQEDSRPIIHRTLGRTGFRLPVVNMGVMNSADPSLVRRSYEIGVRHFDTANYYMNGENERMVGGVIRELGARDEIVLATKALIPGERRGLNSEQKKRALLNLFDTSLERLQTDHVEILYLHNVDDPAEVNDPGIVEALHSVREQGKARFTGFSTHANMTACINAAIASGHHDVILTAWNYSHAADTGLRTALETAAGRGIGIVAMKTQCMQSWYRQGVPAAAQRFYEGRIMHTAVLKWALQPDFIHTAIPGYTTFREMEEDFSVVYDLTLTEEEQRFIDDRIVREQMDYCRQCGECLGTCPAGVDLPALMRVHMYAACYTNFGHARATLREIEPGRDLQACASCSPCRARCTGSVDIAGRIAELKSLYL